jgi:molybdopterin converting factor small subunit
MPTVWIPSLMRDLTGGKERVSVPGRTVGQVIDALDLAYPGTKSRLCKGDRLDPAVTVFVDGRVAPLRLYEAVEEGNEVRFLPAVGGG